MPVYDPDNPQSAEGSALWALAVLLSDCVAFQSLTESADSSEAAERIKIGYSDPPPDINEDEFSEDQLALIQCDAYLSAPIEGERVVSVSDGSPTPDEGGLFDMIIRRYVRESEKQDMDGLYLWFLDLVAALEVELVTKAEQRECPRLNFVQRTGGPAFGARDEVTAQGENLWTVHSISWGDLIGV